MFEHQISVFFLHTVSPPSSTQVCWKWVLENHKKMNTVVAIHHPGLEELSFESGKRVLHIKEFHSKWFINYLKKHSSATRKVSHSATLAFAAAGGPKYARGGRRAFGQSCGWAPGDFPGRSAQPRAGARLRPLGFAPAPPHLHQGTSQVCESPVCHPPSAPQLAGRFLLGALEPLAWVSPSSPNSSPKNAGQPRQRATPWGKGLGEVGDA